jgi:hypothetical protein
MEMTPRTTNANYAAMGGVPAFLGNAWDAMSKARQAAEANGFKSAALALKARPGGGGSDFKLPQFEMDLNKRAYDQYGLKDMKTYMDAFRAIEKSAQGQTGADDMQLLYSYIKLLDPNSAVREGEYGAAASTGTLWDMAKRFAAKGELMSDRSSPLLSPSMRAAFAKSARNAMVSAAQSYRPREQQFMSMVGGYQPWGVDPNRVYQTPFNEKNFSPELWADMNSEAKLGTYASRSMQDQQELEREQAEAEELRRLEEKRRAAGVK